MFKSREKKFLVIHGGVNQINQFVFESTNQKVKQQQLNELDIDCIIGGHCGLPFGQQIEQKYWLNAGVIGLPANDGTQQGWYLLLQPTNESIEVSWHRLTYTTQQSYESMQQANLKEYAESLLTGLWPSTDVLPLAERSFQGQRLQVKKLTINL